MAELTNGLKFSLTNGKLTFTITPSFMATREVSLLLLFKERVSTVREEAKGAITWQWKMVPWIFIAGSISWTVVRHLSKPEEV